jgi:hypothetical protein
MKRSFVISSFFAFLLILIPSITQAQVNPKFPDFPDAPNPGGGGGGGDYVPYFPHVDYFLTVPTITNARMWNGRVHFTFHSDGPVMRYNIVWSRPGKTETDMRWHDEKTPNKSDSLEEYIINEYPAWDTDYSFKVQAESKQTETHPDGSIWHYQITPFREKIFHTPPNPSLSDRVGVTEKHGSKVVVKSIGRVKGLPSTNEPPMSICDRARDAQARNSPAAPNLEAQCRASKP